MISSLWCVPELPILSNCTIESNSNDRSEYSICYQMALEIRIFEFKYTFQYRGSIIKQRVFWSCATDTRATPDKLYAPNRTMLRHRIKVKLIYQGRWLHTSMIPEDRCTVSRFASIAGSLNKICLIIRVRHQQHCVVRLVLRCMSDITVGNF